jgi:hypothetical protein
MGEDVSADSLRGSRLRYDLRVRSEGLSNFLVTCPYCGEEIEIFVEPDVHGSFVQDCEVCCNPWLVRVEGSDEDGEREVSVGRADGSD